MSSTFCVHDDDDAASSAGSVVHQTACFSIRINLWFIDTGSPSVVTHKIFYFVHHTDMSNISLAILLPFMDPIDAGATTATLTLPFCQVTSEPGLMAADSFCWCYILTSTFHYCCGFLDTLMKWLFFSFLFLYILSIAYNASGLVSLDNCIPIRHFSFFKCC